MVYSVNGQVGNVSLTAADIPNAASKGYVNNAIAGNIAVLNASFSSVDADIAAANLVISNHSSRISTLESNAATQSVSIANLNSTKASISYVNASIDNALSGNAILANVASVNANVAAANAAILTKASLSGANFTGNISTDQYIFASGARIGNADIDIDNVNGIFSVVDSQPGAFGITVQNRDSSSNSIGFVAVLADDGTQNENLVVIGVNNSNYTDPLYPDAEPHEAFLFANGGNLRVISNNSGIVFGAGTSRMYLDPIRDRLELRNVNIQFQDGTVQSTAFGGNANVASINANVAAANLRIASLQTATTISNINIASLQTNTGGLAAGINTLTANAATQSISIAAVNAALTLSNANAASQSIEINALRANVIASNANVSILQGNVTNLKAEISNLYSNAGVQASILNTLVSNASVQALSLIHI